MAIKNWLKDERPREKLLAKGAKSLSDAELLAILLRTGRKGKTAIDLARELLSDHGGINAILESSYINLVKYSGIGLVKYVQLQASIELARRHLEQNMQKKDVLDNITDTKIYLIAQLRRYKREVFACVFLDVHNQIIAFDELFFGTIDSSVVHPREIIKKALGYNAAAVIFAHNHPSGIADPSYADKQITHQLIKALAFVDIKVLDHIIVGDGNTVSFVEESLL